MYKRSFCVIYKFYKIDIQVLNKDVANEVSNDRVGKASKSSLFWDNLIGVLDIPFKEAFSIFTTFLAVFLASEYFPAKAVFDELIEDIIG